VPSLRRRSPSAGGDDTAGGGAPSPAIEPRVANEIWVAVEWMRDYTEDMLRFNHGPVLCEVDIVSRTVRLADSFLSPRQEAPKARPQQMISARSVALSFLERWKPALDALETVHQDGVEHLRGLFRVPFASMRGVVDRIEGGVDRGWLCFDTVHAPCDGLRLSLAAVAGVADARFGAAPVAARVARWRSSRAA